MLTISALEEAYMRDRAQWIQSCPVSWIYLHRTRAAQHPERLLRRPKAQTIQAVAPLSPGNCLAGVFRTGHRQRSGWNPRRSRSGHGSRALRDAAQTCCEQRRPEEAESSSEVFPLFGYARFRAYPFLLADFLKSTECFFLYLH